MPIPYLSNKPGPGRPGWGPTGAYDFQLEFQGPGTFSYNGSRADGSTSYSLDLGDGTTYSSLGAGAITHTFGAGTFTILINSEEDSGPLDTFQITGTQANKNRVTKILSWGKVPWKNLNSAFQNCQGLTKIDGGVLTGGTSCNLNSAFRGCTGLTEAICKNWDLSSGCSTYWLFESCTNLELLDLTGAKFAVTAASNFSFSTVGTNVSIGCDFKMANLNLTGTTNSTAGMQWFQSSKFKDGSNLSNWVFPSALNSVRGDQMFNASVINGTLDLSNWTWPNQTFPSFSSINGALTSQNGSKIKLSNWDLSAVSNFGGVFQGCKVYELEGLSTWNACAGGGSAYRMFSSATLMRFNPSDNLSDAFMASLTPIYVTEMFNSFSQSLLDSERGPCPNLNGLDLSNAVNTTVHGFLMFMRYSKWTNTPDFSNVTFPSTNLFNFSNAFDGFRTTGTGSDSVFNFNPITVKPANFNSAFYFAHGLSEVNIGSNVDMSSMTSINGMFRLINYNTAAATFTNVTFPTDADFSSLTSIGNAFEDLSGSPFMSVCQVDNFFRRLRATNDNSNVTANFYSNKVTEAPSVVRSYVDYFDNTKGWNITLPSPDATLPFVYPTYGVNPEVYSTGISPTTVPSGATFSTTTSGVTVNASTGVISWASTFRGGIDLKCTYSNGCYNEVKFIVQVPFVMRTVIPASGSTSAYLLKPQMSAGECFVNWGDTVETLTGDTTHNYPASGSDTTYDIEIFDSPGGSKFEGFNAAWDTTTITSYENSIMKWGDIQWKNNSWFLASLPNSAIAKLRLSAPNGASHKPDLSQVTSLYQLFYNQQKSKNLIWEDVNNNLADWDTSTITNMGYAFFLSGSVSSRPSDSQPNIMQLSNWDTSNVTDMIGIFFSWANSGNGYHPSNIGVDVTNWNTQNVQNFSSAFRCKGTITGIENLRTESCTNMSYMFDSRVFPGNVNTKYVDGALRWDVSKVSNFTSFSYNSSSSQGLFPDKWKLSGDGQDINMANAFYGFDFDINDSPDLCATKTVNETWYGGTSYTAWDMSNTTSISSMFFGAGTNAAQVPPPNGYNPNISTWQMSSKFTTMQYFARADGSQIKGLLGIDQDLGHWNVTNISSPNGLLQIIGFRTADERPSFSTANYDSILSITDGWGSQAANVNSGVNMDFGFSKYSPGNIFEGAQGTNTYQSNSIYGGGKDMEQFVSVGDVVERPPDPNGIFDTYAIVTGFTLWNGSSYLRATTQGNIGPSTYTVMDSDAAKGRVALINAGWNITDGGADIPFASTELIIDVNAGDTFTIFSSGSNNNYSVDWGDGNGFSSTPYTGTSAIGPAYTTGGEKTIKINKDSSEKINALIFYNQVGTINKIKKISNWGTNAWDSLYRAFKCHDTAADRRVHPDFTVESPTPPNFSNGPNISSIFDRCNVNNNIFTNSQVSNWNVRSLNSLYGAFYKCFGFNEDISGWDTSYIISLDYAFTSCSSLNSDISNWDTSRLTTMHTAFSGCSSLNADLNTKDTGSGLAWDVSKVSGFNAALAGTSMSYNIDKWQIKTTGGVYFQSLFNGCNWPNLTLTPKTVTVGSGAYQKTYLAWDTQKVARMDFMIAGNSFNVDIGKWDTSSVTTLDSFAKTNSVFNNGGQPMNARQVTVGTGATARTYTAWDTSNVSSWKEVFRNATSFNQDIGNWDLSGATGNVYRILENASSFNHEVDWVLPTGFTPNYAWGWFFFAYTNMSTVNYTNTIVNFANTVYNNSGLYNATGNNIGGGQTFDSNMSGGANFANAWEARSYLTDTVASGGAGWTLSGDTVLPLLVPSTSSLSFNGSTEYIDVQASPRALVGNSNAYTISAYVFIEEADIAEENYFIIGAMSGTERWYFRVDDGYVGFAYGSIISSTTSTAITAGQWNHVAVTYNGTNTHKIYVDGGNPKYTSTSSTGQTITTNDAYIGALNNGTDSLHFKGKIDEVMVWNTELAQANIQTLANAVGSGNVVNPEQLSSGLQLWNRMGD